MRRTMPTAPATAATLESVTAKEKILAEAPDWTEAQAEAALNAAESNAGLELTILYEDGEEGWIVASIPAVPGVFSQGRTRDEARANVLDALALMLSPEPGEGRERESLHLTVV